MGLSCIHYITITFFSGILIGKFSCEIGDFISRILSIILFPRIIRFVKRNKDYESEGKHRAIIIANDYKFNKESFYVDGAEILIRYFLKNKIPYKVYDKINKQKFKEIILNNNIEHVYIFGHGSKHKITIKKKEYLFYCEFEGYPKNKEFIGQFHCNVGGGKSLAEYIAKNPKKCFVTNNMRWFGNNWEDIKKLIKNSKI
ncbi:MAG: hypothetical protein KKE93_04675 [Nanoarchaeota archaeon]|nr:hypothetical protein [Nanoarchaeota archaeon]